MAFPVTRMRRLRQSGPIRLMVRETALAVDDFMYPMFVTHGREVRREIPSMPAVFQLSVDELVKELADVTALGISSIILFGLPETKDAIGTEAYDDDGIVQRAVRAAKDRFPELIVATDVCLCEYTDHGHCGLIQGERVLNDPTLELLAKTALSHAVAGADIVAPSDMMDGRVSAIRKALDEEGYENTIIMAYSAKYASGFYGPFREAAESAPQFGDRQAYQMDPANVREALREVALDIEEGADIIMVKPALAYLDVVRAVRERFELPLATYNVSGEYAMIRAAAQRGWIDERRVVTEVLTGMKRAGADLILTYFAKDVARWLRG